MTHRERVITALEHRQPDRVPKDLGSSRVTGMVKASYERLRAYLGFGKPGAVVDRMQQVVAMDEDILRYFDVDVRAISQGAPDQGGDIELSENRYQDEWGVVRCQPPGCHYYDLERSPLAGEITAGDIARYPWPDPTDPGRFRGLRDEARRLRDETDFAIMYNARFHPVHMTQYLRGFEDWYLDLGANHALFSCLMDAVSSVLLEWNRLALRELGEYIDLVSFGDDVGTQDRAVCSLPVYRRQIRPAHERFLQMVREHSNAKIFYHTCGSVYAYIPDFMDMGIDALNPVQVTARNMQPERLKLEFGDRISFWGGIDSQRILPRGTPDDVRAEVRRMSELMGAHGGYVMAAVHNIQPDVPPENLCALFGAGKDRTQGRRYSIGGGPLARAGGV
jgi:uroporphyrinogen decarboxylase